MGPCLVFATLGRIRSAAARKPFQFIVGSQVSPVAIRFGRGNQFATPGIVASSTTNSNIEIP
ncbi:hypothetical protein RB11311 [Rhodopirellula baltica SH 1]|uniref:Uncharacterized protein n=1 Tax=Rhodopirellula baltica (strain DSM 10527 / NCIMB 13988 / SH1) TaxID=243090 RepID=Q7UEI6_RHOBA|nr:hypothetical protein RB11311 [Rhodopirellula baltica SH 1]